MTLERKIEAALENYLRMEGWEIVTSGDYYAVKCSFFIGDDDDDEETTINLTELAKRIAEELEVAKC